ncbi:hypothetical protein LSAT2_026525 [Lamellibrachia satsuma]|nr:hypothetical protein LSAT2_026525 [Lamellibrachia satsuma]
MVYSCCFSGEFEVTLRAFYKCDTQRRQDIGEKYSSSFHRDLIADVKELSWKAGFIAETLLVDRVFSRAAKYLFYCLQSGAWRHNMAVVEILCSRPVEELAAMEMEYQNISGHTLVSDLQAKYEDEQVCNILIERLSLKESPDDAQEDASMCTTRLVQAAKNGTLFDDNHLFLVCMKTKSASDLKVILEMFLKQCQRDMTVEIEKHFSEGHTRQALVAMVKLLRNGWLYYAHIIHELMVTEAEDDQRHLLYLVLSLDQDSVRQLKQVYKSTFFEMLARDVKSLVKDTVVQRAILNHIK